jgi:hypothetical protein
LNGHSFELPTSPSRHQKAPGKVIPLGLLKRAKALTRELPPDMKQDHREEIKRFDTWLSYKAKKAYFMLTMKPAIFFSAFDGPLQLDRK